MIEKYITILNQVRTKKAQQDHFAYKEATDSEGYMYDQHEQSRYQLLIAIQFDFKDSDKELLEFLFEQEIQMHDKAPFQGLNTSLRLNAYLLSQFQEVEHVWLFLRAKNANFDTHCGFDREFIVSAGVSRTYDYVMQSTHELKKSFHNLLGATRRDCDIREEDLTTWRKSYNLTFPASVENTSLEDEIHLAIQLGEREILLEKVAHWKVQQNEWTEKALQYLASYQRSAGNLLGEIEAAAQLVSFRKDDWGIASELLSLSSLYLKADQPDAAWEVILRAQPYLEKIPDWKKYGLGRFYVENCMDIVLRKNSSSDSVSQQAYNWGSKNVVTMQNLHLNLLRKTADASAVMGNRKLFAIYDKLHKAETAGIQKMMGKKATQ